MTSQAGNDRFALRLLLIRILLAGLVACSTGWTQDVPRFEGASIPAPPQQSLPWSLSPSGLSPGAIDVITELFTQGFADPRGCEYREIEIVVGNCWGVFQKMKTHGWVLPSSGGQQFGICWNGLVYPLVSIGAPADLRADVLAMVAKDEAAISESRKQNDVSEKLRESEAKKEGKEFRRTNWPLRWNLNAIPEATSAGLNALHPLRAALLLRLGEVELAENVWSQWFGVPLQQNPEDPYLMLATAWVWSLFDRAVCAHMRGDHMLALADAAALVALGESVEAEAARRKPPRPSNSEDTRKPVPYLGFLDVLKGLLSDEQRREKEAPYTPVLEMANRPQGAARIAGLIRDLEQVSARQHSQPGGVDLAGDPIVAALIECGDEAVEPLLDCLENDDRLTRSVRFWRDFSPYRTILGAHEAAYVALASILQSSFFGAASTSDSLTARGKEGRRDVAAKIREYWQRYKGLSLPERWYQILADDEAAPEQWLQAAGNIVQDSDVEVGYSSMVGGAWTKTSNREPGFVPPMRGEVLRAKNNPSVSDLLVKRMNDLAGSSGEISGEKISLAGILAKWDGQAHLGELQGLSKALEQRFSAATQHRENKAADVLKIYKARIQAGDPQALADYAAWIVTVPRDDLGFTTSEIFEIMWRHPENPAIRQAAAKLFTVDDSPWVPLLDGRSGHVADLFRSPLVGFREFRAELLRGLSDKSPAGSAVIDQNGSLSVQYAGWSTGGGSSLGDPLAPKAGTLVKFRICDFYASQIAQLEGAPKFQLYWPQKNRDAAIPLCQKFLKRYGDLFQYQPGDQEEIGLSRGARIHLAPLDSPATDADVADHRAIFSLSGKRRTVPLPKLPTTASWTTLKEYPMQGLRVDFATGKTESVTLYDTQGRVFQAEEVFVDGKWERFFGFVGRNHMRKVPATEIEFPSQTGMNQLSNGFDCRISTPGKIRHSGMMPFGKLTAGAPMPVVVTLRNRRGLDQLVPDTWILPANESKPLPKGVELTLGYMPKIPTGNLSIPKDAWQPVSVRTSLAAAEPASETITLLPTEEREIAKLDLRDVFDVTRPGAYRLQAVFTIPNGSQEVSNEEIFVVEQK